MTHLGKLNHRFLCILIVLTTAQAHAQLSQIKTVFVIEMNRVSWGKVMNGSANYITQVLMRDGASSNGYVVPSGNGSAETNSLWLEAGTDFGINSNDPPSSNHQNTLNHFVALLDKAGISWKTYQEGIDGSTCPTTSKDLYDVRYNPFVFFDDVTSSSSNCKSHIRPYTELENDLANNNIARYNFIKPDICHAMDAACTTVPDRVKAGNDWLGTEVAMITHSAAYRDAGAIFIVWNGSDVPSEDSVGVIVNSPLAKRQYSNGVRYTPGSLLRTLQEIFEVKPLLGNASTQTSMEDFFTFAEGSPSVVLSWTPSQSATSYNIKRSISPNGPFTTIATVSSMSYTDKGLTSGWTYYYEVTALNAGGESPPSSPVSVTPTVVPKAPTNLTVKQVQ